MYSLLAQHSTRFVYTDQNYRLLVTSCLLATLYQYQHDNLLTVMTIRNHQGPTWYPGQTYRLQYRHYNQLIGIIFC